MQSASSILESKVVTPEVKVDKRDEIEREYAFHPTLGNDIRETLNIAEALVVVAEFSGDRLSQEDTYDANSNAKFKALGHESRLNALRNAFADLNNHLQYKESGSTVCMCISWLEEIPDSEDLTLMTYTVYMGDSSAYFTRCSPEYNVTESVRLNPILHHPENERGSFNCPVSIDGVGRHLLNNMLAVSRALGDHSFSETHDKFHKASIAFNSFIIKKNEQPIITVACDGLTEGIGRLNNKKLFSLNFRDHLSKFENAVLSYQGKTIPLKEKMKTLPSEKSKKNISLHKRCKPH